MATPKLTSNKFIPQLHLPSWGWARQAPLASAAGTASCCAKNSNYHPMHGRFIYYLFSTTNFWKYDTVTDGWTQLSVPNLGIATYSSLTFRGDMGVMGNVLGAAAGTITLPTILSAKGYETFEIQIVRGTGAGQRRVISSQAPATVHASGTATAATAFAITDTNKAWQINQWRGYTVRMVSGAGVMQLRRILYNDATSLTFSNVAKAESDVNCYPASPAPALGATAGSQTGYQIESTVCSVESPWAVTPDETSGFEVRTGCVMAMSGTTNAWFLQCYSIAEDLWYVRSGYSGILAANPTDGSLETPDESWSVLWTGKASAGTTTTLTDASANWEAGEWVGRWMFIWSGPGEGALVKITANTQTTLTWVGPITAPTSLTRYRIWSLEAGTVTAGGAALTLTDAAAAWAVDRYAEAYQVRIVSGTGIGQVRRIMSNTATVLTLDKPLTTATDSVYQIQPDASTALMAFALNTDILRYGVDHDVIYRGVERDFGIVAGATAQYAEDRPISIATATVAGAVCTVTTTNPHGFKTGMSIRHRGDTGASAAQNNILATITVTGANTYTYPAPGSTASWTITAQTTGTLKDASKSWTTNQFNGRLVTITGAFATTGLTPVANIMRVQSNTADTLTFSGTAAVPIVGCRYVIHDIEPIGALDTGLVNFVPTTTSFTESGKNWGVNQWAGRYVRFLSGNGTLLGMSLISSNTLDTLTFSAAPAAPIIGATHYAIVAQPIRGAGFEMVLPYNTPVTGDDMRYLYVPRGAGLLGFDVFDLTNGSQRTMSFGQQNEILGTGSMFVYDGGDRIYFTRDATNRCYYFEISTGQVYSAPQIPYVAGTAIVGNRMDIVTTKDRLRVLFVNRHANVETFKTLLWY